MDTKSLLQQIIRTANALQRGTQLMFDAYSGPSVEMLDTQPLDFDIPSLSHLIPDLMQAGAPMEVAQEISTKYHTSAKQLAEYQTNTAYAEAMRKLRFCPPIRHLDFIRSFREAHRKTYRKYLSKWEEGILNSVREKFRQSGKSWREECKTGSFDQNFVPLLEKCFSKNQRPSREDKELLAVRTGMSYRQIHVWFQNRRTRTKKFSERSPSRTKEKSFRTSSISLAEDEMLSSYTAPSYAFPAAYPPEVDEDPFPCRFGDLSFPKPCWRRRTSTENWRLSEQPDVSELIPAFERLQLNDVSEPGTKEKESPASSVSKSATKLYYEMIRPTVVRPLQAPLASLVQARTSCSLPLPGDPIPEGNPENPGGRTYQNRSRPKAKSRKPRQFRTAKGIQDAVDRSLPSAQPANERPPDKPVSLSKSEKPGRKATRSTAAVRRHRKVPAEPEVTAEATRETEKLVSYPSPTTSIDSLPPLSYATESTSSSAYSLSPASSLEALSGDTLATSTFNEYHSTWSSLMLPPSLTTQLDDRPPSPVTFTLGGLSFDPPKGPLAYSSGFDLFGYPSHFDSFDSLSQGLGMPSDPLLSSPFELPCLAS